MDKIRVLDKFVIDQITAGETIQRPASCLKELLENSIDAGASEIFISFEGAGSVLLEVRDNGFGMSREDAVKCIERHATSKISTVADLYNLRTLGFRGEALASIAAVSKMEIRTCEREADVGTLVSIEGGEIKNVESCVCPKGTDIKVKDLFYNIPVRRNFLKSDRTEIKNIIQIFMRVALVNAHVWFRVINNDIILYDLQKETIKGRIERMFGKGKSRGGGNFFMNDFVDLRIDTDIVKVSGFVNKPEACKSLSNQYFFVNGRFMHNMYFSKAVQNAYADIISQGVQPSFFIYIDVPCDSIEVNIHPQKTEIKFKDDSAIFQFLQAGVREAIGKSGFYSVMDFSKSHQAYTEHSTMSRNLSPAQYIDLIKNRDTNYNPFQQTGVEPNEKDINVKEQEDKTDTRRDGILDTMPSEFLHRLDSESESLQIDDTYILYPTPDGLLLIDIKRARSCIYYYMLLEQIRAGKGVSQRLLFPAFVNIAYTDVLLFDFLKKELEMIGFQIVDEAENTYKILSCPALLVNKSPSDVIIHILAKMRQCEYTVKEIMDNQLAIIMAEEAVETMPVKLDKTERLDLIRRLLQLPLYQYTPDGKRVLTLLTSEDFRKMM